MSVPAKPVRKFALLACLLGGASLTVSVQAQAQNQAEITATAPAPQTTGIPAWGIASTDLPADQSILFGKLPNGMRYALQNNGKGGASIRFAIDAGAREEGDDEAGAAHFLEHMAFNGSTNIPEGELIPMLERLGLAFGADTNAVTSMEYTEYKLDLPNTDEATVDAALNIIREMASELTIAPAAVDRERGVLEAEYQARNDPQRRRAADVLSSGLPDSRLGERLAVGADAMSDLTSDILRGFYEGYYRPEKATLAIVGDFDLAQMEQHIQQRFSDWQGKGDARESFAPPVAPRQAPVIDTFTDAGVPEIIELQYLTDYTPFKNMVADEAQQLLQIVATLALSNRFAALSRQADSPILVGQVSVEKLFRSADISSVLVVGKDGQWKDSLAILEQELRRALQHGFTQGEVDEAKANLQAALTNAAAQSAGMPSSIKAEMITQSSLNNSVVQSPEGGLALYQALAGSITPQSVSAAYRAAWPAAPSILHIASKAEIEGGEEAIMQVLVASSQIAVAPPTSGAQAQFAYDDFGPAGAVVSDTVVDDLGIRTIAFANGTRLNLKKTDFEPSSISFQMEVGQGLKAFPADKSGLGLMAQILMPLDGLAAHNTDELRQLMAGRTVSLGLAAGRDAITAAGATTPDDLELQLKLLAARLSASGFRPETQSQWAAAAPVLANSFGTNPSQVFSLALDSVLAGDDGRFGLIDANVLTDRSLADLRAAIEPQLKDGRVDLALVGDFDEDAAIAAFASTIGALPARPSQAASPVTPPSFTAERGIRIISHSGGADQGLVALAWPTNDGSDLKGSLTRSLLSSMFQLRLIEVLREELGATYSPQALSYSTAVPDGFGYVLSLTTATPDDADLVASTMQSVAAEFASQPASSDLLQRARQPILESFEEQLRQNGGWLGIVANAQSHPEYLDRRRQRADLLAGVTLEDIQAEAQAYLTGDPLQIRVLPREE